MKKYLAMLLVVLMGLTILAGCEGSQTADPAEYPKKELTMVVPYGAGGTTDLVGREFAKALSKQLGQSIVVDNKGGASGSVGAQYVLDSEPDGYTIFFTAESLGTQRVMGISEMSYADFAPIVVVANDPKVIVVKKGSEYDTIEKLLDAIKANPGKIQMSYTGPGGSGHVQALIMNQFGYEPALTAYSSGGEGITAVLGDQVVFTNSNFSSVKAYIESGDLIALAVCSTQGLPALPDVPALATIIPGSDALMDIPYTPLSLLVDKDVPEEIQNTLRLAAKEAIKDEEFNQWMEANCCDKLYEKYTSIEEILGFYAQWESTVSWLLFDAGATTYSPEDFSIPRP